MRQIVADYFNEVFQPSGKHVFGQTCRGTEVRIEFVERSPFDNSRENHWSGHIQHDSHRARIRIIDHRHWHRSLYYNVQWIGNTSSSDPCGDLKLDEDQDSEAEFSDPIPVKATIIAVEAGRPWLVTIRTLQGDGCASKDYTFINPLNDAGKFLMDTATYFPQAFTDLPGWPDVSGHTWDGLEAFWQVPTLRQQVLSRLVELFPCVELSKQVQARMLHMSTTPAFKPDDRRRVENPFKRVPPRAGTKVLLEKLNPALSGQIISHDGSGGSGVRVTVPAKGTSFNVVWTGTSKLPSQSRRLAKSSLGQQHLHPTASQGRSEQLRLSLNAERRSKSLDSSRGQQQQQQQPISVGAPRTRRGSFATSSAPTASAAIARGHFDRGYSMVIPQHYVITGVETTAQGMPVPKGRVTLDGDNTKAFANPMVDVCSFFDLDHPFKSSDIIDTPCTVRMLADVSQSSAVGLTGGVPQAGTRWMRPRSTGSICRGTWCCVASCQVPRLPPPTLPSTRTRRSSRASRAAMACSAGSSAPHSWACSRTRGWCRTSTRSAGQASGWTTRRRC